MLPKPRITRTRKGEIRLRLPAEEQALLQGLPAQLRALLQEEPDDPALRRLFPPAYVEHPVDEPDEWGDLASSRQRAAS